jgi:hypothetical protein
VRKTEARRRCGAPCGPRSGLRPGRCRRGARPAGRAAACRACAPTASRCRSSSPGKHAPDDRLPVPELDRRRGLRALGATGRDPHEHVKAQLRDQLANALARQPRIRAEQPVDLVLERIELRARRPPLIARRPVAGRARCGSSRGADGCGDESRGSTSRARNATAAPPPTAPLRPPRSSRARSAQTSSGSADPRTALRWSRFQPAQVVQFSGHETASVSVAVRRAA